MQNKKRVTISKIRSDHGGELKNQEFELFCEQKALNMTSLYQGLLNKWVVETKKWFLQEMARTMLNKIICLICLDRSY